MTELSPREAALAIVPKVTGGLSMAGSGWIAYQVLSDARKRSKTYHRLVALMSMCDFVSSFCYFLSTWPVPQGVNVGWGNPYHYAAKGNQATCTAQGVGIQWGVTSSFFNLLLSLHYLLVIRYNFTERALAKLEPYSFALAIAIGLGLTIPGIFLKIYGNTNLWCWISPNFDLCESQGLDRQECIDRAYAYRWGFYYGPLWTCISLITIAQLTLFATVRSIELKASKWRPHHRIGNGSSRKSSPAMPQSRRVARQAALYVAVFYVTWLPYTSIAATGKFFNPHENFGILLLVVICQPSQGFLNLWVYRRQVLPKTTTALSSKVSNTLKSFKSALRKSSTLQTSQNNTTIESSRVEDSNDKSNSLDVEQPEQHSTDHHSTHDDSAKDATRLEEQNVEDVYGD